MFKFSSLVAFDISFYFDLPFYFQLKIGLIVRITPPWYSEFAYKIN